MTKNDRNFMIENSIFSADLRPNSAELQKNPCNLSTARILIKY